jgi:ABC-type polysaccharide/polyol phosphate export permease
MTGLWHVAMNLKDIWYVSDIFFQKNFQPPPFEEFLEINFQFSIVSILHMEGYDHQ